jgi:hypothetical protein
MYELLVPEKIENEPVFSHHKKKRKRKCKQDRRLGNFNTKLWELKHVTCNILYQTYGMCADAEVLLKSCVDPGIQLCFGSRFDLRTKTKYGGLGLPSYSVLQQRSTNALQ